MNKWLRWNRASNEYPRKDVRDLKAYNYVYTVTDKSCKCVFNKKYNIKFEVIYIWTVGLNIFDWHIVFELLIDNMQMNMWECFVFIVGQEQLIYGSKFESAFP